MVVYTFNPSAQEADADRLLCVLGQASLHRKLQDSQGSRKKERKQSLGWSWGGKGDREAIPKKSLRRTNNILTQ